MADIPKFNALSIAQHVAPLSGDMLDSVDHLLVVAPPKGGQGLFTGAPSVAAALAKLYPRMRKHAELTISTRLENAKATGMTLAGFRAGSAFERLTWARKQIADCLRQDGGRLGVVIFGFDSAEQAAIVEALLAAAQAAAFQLPSFRSKKGKAVNRLRSIVLMNLTTKLDLRETRAAALGNNLARWITAMPPNKLPAAQYRACIESIAEQHGLTHEFLDEGKLSGLRAGAFLAVAQGNEDRDAGILRVTYRPKRRPTGRIALVGKGILFDTGGNNLKPFKNMLDMHIDMQGSAVAFGTLLALAELDAPCEIDCWLAITENRVSARAYKSQDVVTASNGTTIQVIHTDAEGRMVLADALAIAAQRQPQLVIDYATLTGACVTALTDSYCGIFSNCEEINRSLIDAGLASGERVWPFPMDEDIEAPLASEIADVKQCAVDGAGDHIMAARFLSRFVPRAIPWIHIDLSAGQHKGGLAHVPTEITGFGVRFTLELLTRQLACTPRFEALLGR